MTRHMLAASSALATILGVAAPAFAQTATAGAPSSAAPQPTDNSGQVGEIVVTATKRETSLERTPIAISAFSQASLDRQQVKDVTGLADFVPSLHFAQQGDQGAILLTLRGIGNDSAYTEVADPEVAIYVDGIYAPRAQGASVLMYDMQRVEVLRGPQGTLFGRNATVGAISMVTAKPTLDGFHANVEAVGGSYSRVGVKGMVNIPVTDNFALRAAFITDRHDGYIDYQTPPSIPGLNRSAFVTSGKKYDAADQKSARLSARWDLGRFKWDLSGEYYKDTGSPILALNQNPAPGQKFWSALVDTAPETDRYSWGVRSNMSYDFTDHIELAYVAGFSRVGGNAVSDADAGAHAPTQSATGTLVLPNGAFGENRTAYSRYDFWSHEVQLKSIGHNAIDWILGGYYSHEVNKIRFDIDQRNGYRDGTFNWSGTFVQADREIDSRAAFGQAVWHATSRINLTGGIRYTSDKKQDIGGRNLTYCGGAASTNPNCYATSNIPGIFGIDTNGAGNITQVLNALNAESAALGYGSLWGTTNNDTKGKWNKVTWLARADMQVTDTTLVYGSVSTGFKSGNIEDGGLLAGPETLTNYEVGSKSRLFGGRATLNLAAYYEDFKGYQVNQAETTRDAAGNITGSQIVTTNAQGAKAYGVEAELTANITRLDRVNLAATYQHTRFDSLVTVNNGIYNVAPTNYRDLKGNELPHAPHFSMTGTYEHDFPLVNGARITPRGTVHYETRSWLSYFNGDGTSGYAAANLPGKGLLGTAYDQQKAYAKIDLGLTYASPGDRYEIEAFGLNVTDKRIRTSAGVSGPTNGLVPVFLSNYEAPATWGVRVRAKF
ncbi:TonB-dependent receptor [Sphingomonas nostoxanthinifaciens]|uniref:TonB-dependent receptor n=1 Tax=Sphingomonas nostoxanthinifaciens TaxID=2872652 RepID=UPI001CC1EE4F|nr:TonB-dependent receptor [Sphingomonas nostoxanthinifaciens]UAK25804.1 TonB-dependent receptor [Sphingomonas nostoxanthinifaciens]